MSETPRLEIGRTAPKPLLGPQEAITLDGTPLTDEENELAAATIAAHRMGCVLDYTYPEGYVLRRKVTGYIPTGCNSATPAEAYRAATRDEES